MSIQKDSRNETPDKAEAQEHRSAEDESSVSMSRQGIDVMSLEIAPDRDSGGDPYNRTGSYCVIKVED